MSRSRRPGVHLATLVLVVLFASTLPSCSRPSQPTTSPTSTTSAEDDIEYSSFRVPANSFDRPPDAIIEDASRLQDGTPEVSDWRWVRTLGSLQVFAGLSAKALCIATYHDNDRSSTIACKRLADEGYLALRNQSLEIDTTIVLVPDDVQYAKVGDTRCRALVNSVVIDNLHPEDEVLSLVLADGSSTDTSLPPSSPEFVDASQISRCS